MTERYEAIEHVFYSNNSTDNLIYIKPGLGQTLIIDGTVAAPSAEGIDGSVQFNSLGDLAGDSTFLYDTINNNLTIPHVSLQDIKGYKDSNDLGYSTIYQGPNQNFPQTINTAIVQLNNFGTDIQLSRESNNIAIACPNYIFGASTGGVCVYEQSVVDDPFIEYPTALLYTNFTLEATVSSASINETGDKIAFVDRSELGYIYIYENIVGVWTKIYDNNFTASACKYSVDGSRQALLYVDENTYFKVYDLVNPEQNLVDFSIPFDPSTLGLSINKTVLAFYRLENLFIYKYNSGTTTWDSTYSYVDPLYEYSSIDILAVGSGYIATTTNNNFLKIIENGVITSFAGTFSNSCINSTYVFAFDGSLIKIYQKLLGVWTLLPQYYSTSSITRMSCNEEYLVCARLSTEDALILKIVPYTNGPILINTIDLYEGDNKLHIDTEYGTEFNASNVLVPNLTVNTSANILMANGTVVNPSLAFDGGLYGFSYDGTSIHTSIGSVSKFEFGTATNVSSNKLRIPDGTFALPALSFINDSDTGIYRIGTNNIAIACNGAKQLDISTTNITAQKQIFGIAGTAASPGLALGLTNYGCYQFGTSLGFSTAGVSALTTDSTHTVSVNPFRSLSAGTAAIPVFSTVGDTNSGMYSAGADNISISTGGTSRLSINNSNITSTVPIYCASGTGSAPGLSFSGSTNTGLWSVASDELDITVNGTNIIAVHEAGNSTAREIFEVYSTGTRYNIGLHDLSSTSHTFIAFISGGSGGTVLGSIFYNGSSMIYSASDYRLKDNIEDLNDSLNYVNKLKPKTYVWKSTGVKTAGFIADEVKEAFCDDCNDMVCGEKDEIEICSETGEEVIKPQLLCSEKLIPYLVGSVKELTNLINELRTEITNLKTELIDVKKELASFEIVS